MYVIFFSSDDNNMEEEFSVTNVTDPNDGRNRRKVMFRSDDMKFSDLDESDTQDDDDDDDDNDSDIEDINPVSEENDDSDSEWSDSEDETEKKKDKADKSRFYGQSFGKENEIRKKIANELAKLDKINQESNNSIWNEREQEEQNYSDDDIEYDEDDSESDNSSDESDDNKEDNITTKVSDENDIDDKDINNSLVDKSSHKNLQETNGGDSTLNWKKNLAQKAANAYYERQNSVANLWKLVYGKLFNKINTKLMYLI